MQLRSPVMIGATAAAAALLVLAAVTLSYNGLPSYSVLENVQPEQCVSSPTLVFGVFPGFWWFVGLGCVRTAPEPPVYLSKS